MSNYATTYYRSYSRALNKYVNNGFFARDLDADDFAFIERVRERGCVSCGSLAWPAPTACTHSDDIIPRVALIEEMEFWQYHQTDKAIVRRHGPPDPPQRQVVGTTAAAIKRKQDRELKAAAVAEEVRRLEEKQREQLRRDIEWERAAKPLVFGRTERRHFVPQWKINDDVWTSADRRPPELTAAEQAELDEKRTTAEKRVAARKLAREIAHRKDERLTVQEAEDAADRILGIEPECDRQERLSREYWQQRATAEQAAEAQRRQQQAAETQQRKAQKLEEAQQAMMSAYGEFIKTRILQALQLAFPNMLTLEQLMISTGCRDKDFMIRCSEALLTEGRMKRKTEPAV